MAILCPWSVWPLPSTPWQEAHFDFHVRSVFLSTSARPASGMSAAIALALHSQIRRANFARAWNRALPARGCTDQGGVGCLALRGRCLIERPLLVISGEPLHEPVLLKPVLHLSHADSQQLGGAGRGAVHHCQRA